MLVHVRIIVQGQLEGLVISQQFLYSTPILIPAAVFQWSDIKKRMWTLPVILRDVRRIHRVPPVQQLLQESLVGRRPGSLCIGFLCRRTGRESECNRNSEYQSIFPHKVSSFGARLSHSDCKPQSMPPMAVSQFEFSCSVTDTSSNLVQKASASTPSGPL